VKGRLRGGGVGKCQQAQPSASLCPLTELLQVSMHCLCSPLKSIAHLPSDLCNITFVIRFSSIMQK